MGIDRRTFLKGTATGALAAGLRIDAAFSDERKSAVARNIFVPSAGQWLQFRGDRALTGRSALKGSINEPAINWKHFCGSRETLFSVEFHHRHRKPETHALPGSDHGADPRVRADERTQALSSYDGNSFSSMFQVGKFLPGEPGLQIVECESCFGKYDGYQPPHTAEFCQLLTRVNDQWRQVWKSEPIDELFVPNVIVGDFDGDGKLEVAFTPWYDLWVLDLETGKLKAKCRFTPPGAESGRAYGYLGAFDIDGDGKQEFVILPDFENQMAVMAWRDGKLELLWNRLIERGIDNKKTLIRPGAEPVQDIDGDGKMEIVMSLFNITGDDRWHVVALDGLTGQDKLNLADEYLTGLHDIDGDGICELFLTKTEGPLVPEASELSVAGFNGGRLVRRAAIEGSSFQTRVIQDYPSTVQNGTATRGLTILAAPQESGGLPVFFTRKKVEGTYGSTELVAWRADGSKNIEDIGSFRGPYLEAVVAGSGARDAGSCLLKVESLDGHPAQIESRGARLRPVFCGKKGVPLSNVVVAPLTPDAAPAIITQAAGETIEAFLIDSANSAPHPLWRAPGRGIYTGGQTDGGLILADLHGDGRLATLAATIGPKGCARLVSLDSEGRQIWSHDFERFSGATPIHNDGGLLFWFAGRFNDPKRDDVMVCLARHALHSGSNETFLLDGRTGNELWRRTKGTSAAGRTRACGGDWVAIYDHDGDGLDDALLLYPDGILVMHGAAGKTLLDRSTNGRSRKGVFPGTWTFYATPAVADLDGNGSLKMVYGATSHMLAVLNLDGTPVWHEPIGPTPPSLPESVDTLRGHFGQNVGNHTTPVVLPGIGDVDGDGKLELLSPGHRREPGSKKQDFHCYDAATGTLKWKLPLPGSCFGANCQWYADSPTTPAVADIDGDGREEAIFGIGKVLYAVGGKKGEASGEVRWTLEFPGRLGSVAIADTRGDGRPEIVVGCADGNLYGVGAVGRGTAQS